MTHPVIDTLRLADRLKESGFGDRQAEGLARALGSEITEHLATKANLDAAIEIVRGDYHALDAKFEAKFNALSTQIKFIFAMLGVLMALGLVDTVLPLLA